MFQNLEYYTEKLWHDFSDQYSSKKNIMSKESQEEEEEEAEEAEEENQSSEEEVEEIQESLSEEEEEPQPVKTFWGRVY